MCSIFLLNPGYTLPYEMLFNAVHNNEHGYGIVLKENKKLQVIKELPQEVNPEKIYKILKDNEDVERWVHLRNSSAGIIHLDNVQPISVYHSSKREVVFMHNGTISGMMNTKEQIAAMAEELDINVQSDSKRYAIAKIAPILLRMKGNKGFADLEDPFIADILEKAWQYSYGRGVLISSDQPYLLLNRPNWESVDDKQGKKFLAANDEYFKEIKRGTLFLQRKAEEDAKKANSNTGKALPRPANKNGREIEILKSVPFEETLSVSEDMKDILEEYDLYSPEGYIAMAYLEQSELEKLFSTHPLDGAVMFMFVCSWLKESFETIEKLSATVSTKTLEKIMDDKKDLIPVEEEIHVG